MEVVILDPCIGQSLLTLAQGSMLTRWTEGHYDPPRHDDLCARTDSEVLPDAPRIVQGIIHHLPLLNDPMEVRVVVSEEVMVTS